MKKLLLLLSIILTYNISSGCNAFFTHSYACAGDTVFFQAVDQFGVYTWDFGDTASGTANVSHDTATWHVYNTPGTYYVTLFVNVGVEWDYRSQFITIGTDCFNASFSSECNGDSSLNFINESTGNYTSVLWDFGDPSSAANQDTSINATHAFSGPGTYSVTLIITDGTNSDTTVQPVFVSGGCLLVTFYNFLGGDCVQDTTHIAAYYSGNPTSFSWDFGDTASGSSNTSTDSSGVHQYSVPGTYLVTLIVSNAFETDTFYNIQNIIDCSVWPGNANTDGEVNMEDLFAIGIYFGDTGIARSSVSNTWASQPSTDWNTVTFNYMYLQDLIDKKHADCNGDGVVNQLDITAINQNYGSHLPDYPHNDLIQMMPVAANDPVLEIVTPPSYNGTYNVSLPINLSSTDSVQDVYGIAMRVYYDAAMVVPGSMNVNINGWLGTGGIDVIELVKDSYANGYVDIGIVRTDKNMVTGNGTIANLEFTLAQSGGAINFGIDPIIRLISNGSFTKNQEIFKPVSGVNSQFNFLNVSVEENPISNAGIYPNPSNGIIHIHSIDHSDILKISICDVEGKEVLMKYPDHSQAVILDAQNLSAGIYVANITTTRGVSRVKVAIE